MCGTFKLYSSEIHLLSLFLLEFIPTAFSSSKWAPECHNRCSCCPSFHSLQCTFLSFFIYLLICSNMFPLMPCDPRAIFSGNSNYHFKRLPISPVFQHGSLLAPQSTQLTSCLISIGTALHVPQPPLWPFFRLYCFPPLHGLVIVNIIIWQVMLGLLVFVCLFVCLCICFFVR